MTNEIAAVELSQLKNHIRGGKGMFEKTVALDIAIDALIPWECTAYQLPTARDGNEDGNILIATRIGSGDLGYVSVDTCCWKRLVENPDSAEFWMAIPHLPGPSANPQPTNKSVCPDCRLPMWRVDQDRIVAEGRYVDGFICGRCGYELWNNIPETRDELL